MATLESHTIFCRELTPELYLAGYRSGYEYMNAAARKAAVKKFFKKNGSPRKNCPSFLSFVPDKSDLAMKQDIIIGE